MKYGDYDNVTRDVKTLNEIMSRQGTALLLDVIAEKVGIDAAPDLLEGTNKALRILNDGNLSCSERVSQANAILVKETAKAEGEQ